MKHVYVGRLGGLMLRWVGAILMGLGLVLGASAVDRLPSMRLDTWESATVSLVPGAEVRLDYSHGMKGGRAVRLLVDAPEGYLALPDAPELTVTWWRRAGTRTLASGDLSLRVPSSATQRVARQVESFSTDGDVTGAIVLRVNTLPDGLVGALATMDLFGPPYAGFAIADAALVAISLGVGALFALLTGVLLLFLPREAVAELGERPAVEQGMAPGRP
ncbi:MAG: hypothetical protein R3E85_15460 [Planctomycetota bacterium]